MRASLRPRRGATPGGLPALAAALLLLLAPAGAAPAATIALSAVDAGFINAEGRTSKNDGVVLGATDATFNYSAGAIDEVSPLSGIDVPRKNFFTFDLSGISEPIVSATLGLYNPPGGYSSPESSETYVLGGADVPGAAEMESLADDLESVLSILVSSELSTAVALYGEVAKTLDLALPDFGAVEVSAADDDTFVEVPLTVSGIDYLNDFLGGRVVLGGALATLNGVDTGDEVIFGFTKPLISGVVSPDPAITSPTPTPVLMVTTIPEPGTALLLGAGLLGLGLRRGAARAR